MIISDSDLKSCPFCGEPGVMFEDYRYINHPTDMWRVFGVKCSNEDCIMHQEQKFYKTESSARQAWNHRKER